MLFFKYNNEIMEILNWSRIEIWLFVKFIVLSFIIVRVWFFEFAMIVLGKALEKFWLVFRLFEFWFSINALLFSV